MYGVLLVEDDDFLRKATKNKLEAEGYRVLEATDRPGLTKQLETGPIHIILLDIVLHKTNGIELIEDIKKYTNAPIIIVSSKTHLFDKVVALEMGADDYMCKPVEAKELLSRIKAHIRRYVGSQENQTQGLKGKIIRFGPWVADCTTYSVKNDNGEEAGLTKDEFDLLVTMARAPQVVFTRDRLFDILKADHCESFDRAIDIQIARIRKKLGDDAQSPSFIKTVRKVGYQFIAPVEQGN